MEIYSYCEENGISRICGDENAIFVGASVCLGGFDGIHKGHKALFDVAKSHGKWGVLLFDRNIKGYENLTIQGEKIKLIEEYGADFVVIAEFSEKFARRSPEEFVQVLENILNVSHIICGYDYRFGHMAKGDAMLLKELCKKAEVTVLEPVGYKEKPIKSTVIRHLIKNGEIVIANELLGYDYFVSGTVEKGFENGRKMGFPTANISYPEEKLLPADGVYYGRVLGMNAVINVGKNPTFNARKRTVEVHIPNFTKDIYGEFLKVEFLEKIRDDIKFDSIENLITQINNDIEYVKERKDKRDK